MSSLYDGTPDPLTYGQALVLLAGQVAWPSEAARNEVTDAIRKEHGLELAKVEPVYSDGRDKLIADLEREREQLREQLAKQEADARVGALQAEVEAQRAQLAKVTPAELAPANA